LNLVTISFLAILHGIVSWIAYSSLRIKEFLTELIFNWIERGSKKPVDFMRLTILGGKFLLFS
jgi:Na+-transporting NADH:ubiquinone oxidoreductase subunit NqrB